MKMKRKVNILFVTFAIGIIVSPCESFARTSLVQTQRCPRRVEARMSANDDIENMGTWNPLSLAVLRLGFTEPAWTSTLNYNKSEGLYRCASCRTPLFSSAAKYDSGSGWPSFWKTIAPNRVALKKEWDGRIECLCANCDGHLGHVFPDGPTRGSLNQDELETVPESDPKIGYEVQQNGEFDESSSKYSRMPRFCINGLALRFEKGGE